MLLSREQFRTLFFSGMEKNGLSYLCRPAIADKFHDLTERMLETNRFMNLTAITEPSEVIVKHYADCAKLLPYLCGTSSAETSDAAPVPDPDTACGRLADIGTGAGFPSLPLAILCPGLRIVAVDSTKKKLDYVAGCADFLGLSNISVLCGRAETLAGDPLHREAFDFVTARAVASLPVLSELCLPFVRNGGLFLAMKGKNADTEVEDASSALKKLGGMLLSFERDTLFPISDEGEPSERASVVIRKIKPTDRAYPRPYAKIKNSPL